MGLERERGRGWRYVEEHRMGTETGEGTRNESSSGKGNGDKDGDVNRTKTKSRRGEERRRTAKKQTRIVKAIKHFHSARLVISADRRWRLQAPDSSARKARCLNEHIAQRGSMYEGRK